MTSALTFRVVIPSRYDSTRLPGKALADLAGKPLVQHVYERACESSACEVVIATDDDRIAAACDAFDADVVMTRPDHVSGTDRVAEVAQQREWGDQDIVVNVQGDVPLLPGTSIDQVADLLASHPDAGLGTLCLKISDSADYTNPNVVKLVFDQSGKALYFSRAAIPSTLHHGDTNQKLPEAWRHIGLYAYRVETLRQLTVAQPCLLEQTEKLEQLRALWLGIEIRVAEARESHGPDVDTPEDLEAVARLLQQRREPQ